MTEAPPNVEGQLEGPELFLALVGAIGTDLESVSAITGEFLKEVNYTTCPEPIRLSKLLHDIPGWEYLSRIHEEEIRYKEHMDKGNELRQKLGQGDALALEAIGAIRKIRSTVTRAEFTPASRRAYILHSLKHPKEVETLRKVYGSSFLLVATYSPHEKRLQHLASKIAGSHHYLQATRYRGDAESLIQRDEAEPEVELGQNVRDTFPMADVFIDASDPARLRKSIERFVRLIFGDTFLTPTRDECGMFHARAAALRSAALSRQVGAVVSTDDGDIIAVGTNEVPKAGGGLYWCDDPSDQRDCVLGYDPSDRMKRNLLADILKRLGKHKWLNEEIAKIDIDNLVDTALGGGPSSLMKGSQLKNLIEFGRSVHAEMAALIDAARRGVAARGCTLYTTTFPCHDCTKHIVAAGIRKVVYIEPYPKSLAPELYLDSIAVDGYGGGLDQVSFEPFVGIAPRRYMDLFEMGRRKEEDGTVTLWDKVKAFPRLAESFPLAYVVREQKEVELFRQKMAEKGLRPNTRKEVGDA